jgi:beta-lactam-binding protein with PASTA domain
MDIRSVFGFKNFDQIDPHQYKVTVLSLVGVIVIMVVSAILAFFLALRGEEKTLVPDVQGMELSAALIKLQDKELYPKLSLRFSDDPETKGRILEQEPLPGAIVKAGRRINIVVSRGAAQDRVGDYIGQNIDEVKLHLQTVFASTRQLITVREPPMFLYDSSPAGTILQQDPPSDTELSQAIELSFVVSRGPEKAKVKVPDMLGLDLKNAALQLERAGVNFSFSTRGAEGREAPGSVVSQLPAPGTLQDPTEPVALVYALPADANGLVSGLFSQELPEYPYPLRVVLYAESPNRSRSILISVDHPGRSFTLPYSQPQGTVLELQVLNRVVARYEVGR